MDVLVEQVVVKRRQEEIKYRAAEAMDALLAVVIG
jgi:hypothetical protein